MEKVQVTRRAKCGRHSLIDAEMRNNIVRDFNNGMSQTAIARKYGYSQPTISKVIRDRIKGVR